MTADTQDAERLAELRRDWSDSDEIVAFLFDQLDARDARIAELEKLVDGFRESRDEHYRERNDARVQRDRLTAALADQRALAAEAQRGNAATIGELRDKLEAALGYMTNAMVDLETGAPKRTALATIKGGMDVVRRALRPAAAAEKERTT